MSSSVSIVEKKDCSGCSSCFNACPVNAIAMNPDSEGFLYPYVDPDKCIGCGKCISKCPACNKPVLNKGKKAYAAYARNEEEHKASSSGGIFAVLANYFLNHGGYICGAAFDQNMHLRHIVSDRKEDLAVIRETKYVQSEIGIVYQEIEELLNAGSPVLFCGTPCQAAGLRQYLGKEYNNLLIMDLICHGVPSPKVFEKYLEEIGSDSKVVRMTFRDKSSGMNNVLLKYYCENGDVIEETYGSSAYIRAFLQNMSVRPSCFACKYKGLDRTSDITIGDFWGLNDYHPEMISEQGTSAVLIHSINGQKWFDLVKDDFVFKVARPEEAAFWNTCLKESVEPSLNRTVFFQEYETAGIHDTAEKYYVAPVNKESKPSMIDRAKTKVKGVLSKIGIKR